MGKLISLGLYLAGRVAHAIFNKKEKEGGRDTDHLFEAVGAVQDSARDRIVQAGRMMHPATSEGTYCDRHGTGLGGLYRIPSEEDEDYTARLADPWTFWRMAGSGTHLVDWLFQIGWTAATAAHPTRWAPFVLSISEKTGLTEIGQFLADVNKWRPAHKIALIELSGDLAYAGADHQTTGWDSRPALDWIKEF